MKRRQSAARMERFRVSGRGVPLSLVPHLSHLAKKKRGWLLDSQSGKLGFTEHWESGAADKRQFCTSFSVLTRTYR